MITNSSYPIIILIIIASVNFLLLDQSRKRTKFEMYFGHPVLERYFFVDENMTLK